MSRSLVEKSGNRIEGRVTATAKSLQSCPTLCDPIDGSPPGSPVLGILQARKVKSESEVAESCPTLTDPMDYSLPGSSVHGIFQARVLEWVPLPSRRQSKQVYKKVWWRRVEMLLKAE